MYRSYRQVAAIRGILLGHAVCILAAQSSWGQERLSYNRDIKPILADKCFACHGFDETTRQAGLRLDTFQGATSDEGGDPAIVPGNSADSSLWLRITSDDPDEIMPPPSSHKVLSADEIDRLKRWIDEGAIYEMHWAFTPIVRPPIPGDSASDQNPIDRFIEARLSTVGRRLAPAADRRTLIRRVAFTLTGLPPTVAEVRQFLADESPHAYQAMVDRYLASPHYGEEMARHWLDLARYGDTHGLHLDNERQMWAYRDWVVNSFNRNQPFHEFTIEQLAGDLLPAPTIDQLVATGFNRCNVTTSEGGAIDDEFRYRYAVDRTVTMAETWLGLTAGCAVCHDHKFDPISTEEFYSLYAFFNSAADPPMDGNALLTNPVLRLSTPEDEQQLAQLDSSIRDLEEQIRLAAAAIPYLDPADADQPVEVVPAENIWFDDDFPAGGQLLFNGHPTQLVSADQGPVYRGLKSLKRTSEGLAQDVWYQAKIPLRLPREGRLFAWVFIDAAKPPQAVMLQFHRENWDHRAVWGDINAILWGEAHTASRVYMGPLPESGKWTKLEVPLENVGLNPGDELSGFALTQFGGTVSWDLVGVTGIIDPANDPSRSFRRWWESVRGVNVPDLPAELKDLAQGGPREDAPPELVERLRHHYLTYVSAETKVALEPLVNKWKQRRLERDEYDRKIPRTFVFRDGEKRQSFVMKRGQYDQPGKAVEPNVPAVLPKLRKSDDGRPANRLDLARWIMAEENPLTARVIVNRLWQKVFGTGLVKSSGDFGTQGDLPSHPELLDFLATEFRESGWNVKQFLRLLMTSETFRQSSRMTPDLLELDPENRLLARGPRFRLDAEQIRDNALAVSGLLDKTFGGKGVKPYQPPNIWEPVGYIDSNTRNYKQDSGSALYRRSLYTFLKRTAPPPFMVNFDAPNREQSCSRRQRSNTPLQALQLLNDVQQVEAARKLAERVMTEGPASPLGSRISAMYEIVLAREPRPAELEILQQQYELHRHRYELDQSAAEALLALGESPRDRTLPSAELAALTLLASTLLNLDETLNLN